MRLLRNLPRLIAALVVLAPAPSAAWVVQPEHGYGQGIVRMTSGDLVTCGAAEGTDRWDFSVRRQRPSDGSNVWHYRLDGSDIGFPGSFDSANAVALDGAGDILAAGTTRNVGSGSDVQIVKLDPDGAARWTRQIDSATHADDSLADMAVDAAGDVVVTGTFSVSEAVANHFSIAKVAGATGEPRWQHDVPAPQWSSGVTVGVDSAGDVLATGDFATSFEARDIVALKLDGATGTELWRVMLGGSDGPYDDDARVATIDAAGDLYVGGRVNSAPSDGFTVYKLSGVDGSLLWRYDHRSHDEGQTTLLALDGAGHLYAGGVVSGFFVHDRFHLEKLSTATGLPVWSRRIQGPFFITAAFDPAGDMILGGFNLNGLFTLRKVRASDGRKRWQRQLPGNTYNGGAVTGVTTDTSGDVYAVGADVDGFPAGAWDNGTYSYTVLKACARDGQTGHTDRCR